MGGHRARGEGGDSGLSIWSGGGRFVRVGMQDQLPLQLLGEHPSWRNLGVQEVVWTGDGEVGRL